jgi:hypothetical protein
MVEDIYRQIMACFHKKRNGIWSTQLNNMPKDSEKVGEVKK